jgi:hypothetical protein
MGGMRGDPRDDDPADVDRWRASGRSPYTRSGAYEAGRSARQQTGGLSPRQAIAGRRGALLGLVALVALISIALLTVCLYGAVVPRLADILAGPPTIPVNSTVDATSAPTARATGTATAIAPSGNGDWDTFKLYDGGFQVDVPGVLASSHGYFINNFSGQGVDLSYTGATLSTPLQRLEAHVKVSVLYSTKITNLNICPQGGTPVQAGSGSVHLSAWQRDQGDTVFLNLVLNGEAIEISMTSRVSGQAALPTYAEIWQHMLASIAPLPGQTAGTTHPCG